MVKAGLIASIKTPVCQVAKVNNAARTDAVESVAHVQKIGPAVVMDSVLVTIAFQHVRERSVVLMAAMAYVVNALTA